jgi:SAM-dependent methyltransferase
MAYTSTLIEFVNESLSRAYVSVKGLKMLELGDQVCIGMTEQTGKEYFAKLGIQHTSVDLNGLHGALQLDLNDPLQFSHWNNYFDVVTNSGTSEHVTDQYAVFKICHDVLKVGGLAIHIVPDAYSKNWEGHGIHTYTAKFFEYFALIGYEILHNEVISSKDKAIDGLLCVAMGKAVSLPFRFV